MWMVSQSWVYLLFVVDGVPSWSHFYCWWTMSHPAHGTRNARGGGGFIMFTLQFPLSYLVPQEILVTAPEMQEDGRMFTWLGFQLLFIPQLGATRDPGHGTKIMRGVKDGMDLIFILPKGRDPRDLTSISLFLSSKITKPDATRCHGTRGCKRHPSTSLY